MEASRLDITLERGGTVSALLQAPTACTACLVLAHGAGAGMTHSFLTAIADGLCTRGIATLRYQFPYMEKGTRRPDPPAVAQVTVRAAVDEANRRLANVPLFAGGKSFGGRMTSQAQAVAALPNVRGLIFLGFPLHAANKPSVERARHLDDVAIPMLFVQGSRDPLAEASLIGQVVDHLGPRATMLMLPDADHSFHVPARSGRSDGDIREQLLDAIRAFLGDAGAA
ncbi:MAG TPA: alpha/beta family hydrolase [Acetobacteraceae bacterium]|nr:alpha/beta family hydrolase [Acetobacteraceae bacterium]